jgi:hypothetical protein
MDRWKCPLRWNPNAKHCAQWETLRDKNKLACFCSSRVPIVSSDPENSPFKLPCNPCVSPQLNSLRIQRSKQGETRVQRFFSVYSACRVVLQDRAGVVNLAVFRGFVLSPVEAKRRSRSRGPVECGAYSTGVIKNPVQNPPPLSLLAYWESFANNWIGSYLQEYNH